MDKYFINNTKTKIKEDEIVLLETLKEKVSNKKFSVITMNQYKYLFRNSSLSRIVSKFDKLNIVALKEIYSFLEEKESFQIAFEDHFLGKNDKITLARASKIERWPMGTHYWVRDNALIAYNLSKAEEEFGYQEFSKAVLFSSLNIMSSDAQLNLFKEAILNKQDKIKWPQIFLDIKNNLDANIYEPWEHRQDAWQLLLLVFLKRLNKEKFVNQVPERFFLLIGLGILFLEKIDFINCENAGSWEEIASKRSSVLGIEVAFLKEALDLDEGCVNKIERLLKASLKLNFNFKSKVKELLSLGCLELKNRLPYESPDYKLSDPEYRKEDAALIYILKFNVLNTIAGELNLDSDWIVKSQARIIQNIEILRDDQTLCIKRYLNDVYQRSSYFRSTTLVALSEHFGGASGAASEKESFKLRAEIIPKGREACWTHFVWQLVSYFANEFIQTKNKSSYDLMIHNFFIGLSNLLGDDEYSLVQDEDGQPKVVKMPELKFTECFIADEIEGEEIIFPSPHTPLNWSTAEALNAFSMVKIALEH